MPHSLSIKASLSAAGTTAQRVDAASGTLAIHAASTLATTSADAKHDTTFGIAAYSLGILKDLMRIGTPTTILARLGLRALMEAYITIT